MAFIFEKVAGSGNCFVLDPREKLIVPFDFGTNWQEIRMGIFCSFTTIGSLNEVLRSETIYNELPNGNSFASLIPSNVFYVGFKDSSDILPYNSGSFYAGWTAPIITTSSNENSNALSSTQSIVGGNGNGQTIVSGSTIIDTRNRIDFFMLNQAFSNLNTGFGAFNCIVLQKNNNGVGSVFHRSLSTQFTDVSVRNLRKQMDLITTAGASPKATGYIGDNISAGFIYAPFLLNRLRIHSLVIERYS